MIKHLTLLLTATLLVFNLTACGCSAEGSGSTGNNDSTGSAVVGGETSGTTEDSASSSTGTSNGEPGSGTGGSSGNDSTSGGSQNGSSGGSGEAGANTGDSLLEDAQDAVNDGINDAKDALDGSSKAGGVSFRQMVRNARVHDTDGDLTDGENSRSDGKLF